MVIYLFPGRSSLYLRIQNIKSTKLQSRSVNSHAIIPNFVVTICIVYWFRIPGEVSRKWQENYSIPDFVTLRRILTSSLCDLEVEVGYPRTGVLWGRSWLRWTVWPTCLLESLDSLSSCRQSRRRRWGSRSPESDRTPLKQFQMIGTMKYICSRPSCVQYRNQQECQECRKK